MCGVGWERNLRNHGRVASRAHANDSAGYREHLIGTRRTVVGSHFERRREKKKERKRDEDEWTSCPRARTFYGLGGLNAIVNLTDGERYRHC